MFRWRGRSSAHRASVSLGKTQSSGPSRLLCDWLCHPAAGGGGSALSLEWQFHNQRAACTHHPCNHVCHDECTVLLLWARHLASTCSVSATHSPPDRTRALMVSSLNDSSIPPRWVSVPLLCSVSRLFKYFQTSRLKRKVTSLVLTVILQFNWYIFT